MKTTTITILLILLFLPIQAKIPIMGDERSELYIPLLLGKKVGIVVNHTSVLPTTKTHILDKLLSAGIQVTAIFTPEHGFRGEADAGASVKDGKDRKTGIPMVSLYGSNKKPTTKQMDLVDVMVFDIQDVGTRFYTYISTMYYVMEACAESGKMLLVLDRPNPNDYIDGPVLQETQRSFVGIVPIPLLHGLTVGELALMINGEHWLKSTSKECPLKVIPIKDWHHGQSYSLSIKPSPNLPNERSIQLYPSLCLFEATKVSVGRGTLFPFTVLGAPDSTFGTFTFTPESLAGYDTNPLHKGKKCYGSDLREDQETHGLSLKYLIEYARKAGGIDLLVTRRKSFDLLAGTDLLYNQLKEGMSESDIKATWKLELGKYRNMRKKYLLYEE